MTHAAVPLVEDQFVDPVEDHLTNVLLTYLNQKVGAIGRPSTKVVRLLCASPGSPAVRALMNTVSEFARRGYEFRLVFAERGREIEVDELTFALDDARPGLSMRRETFGLVGGSAARQVNESLVVADQLAWIGAPMPDQWAVQSDLGQIIQRPSAVHLAAMGFESVRVGARSWHTINETEELKPVHEVIRTLLTWRRTGPDEETVGAAHSR